MMVTYLIYQWEHNMKFISAYVIEPVQALGLVKIKKQKKDTVAMKYKNGKPSGICTRTVVKVDEADRGYDWVVGCLVSVLQQGVIPHREDLNYRLNDEIYVKNGGLTTEKTKYKVGKVVPGGIYMDFT